MWYKQLSTATYAIKTLNIQLQIA